MNSELLQLLIIIYIISAFALLFNNTSNKYSLVSLYILFVVIFTYALYLIDLEKRNKRKQIKQKEEEETKVEETEQNPEVSQSINNNQREDYLCNYNDNPQCYRKECKGFGMNGRPFEFEYTPETDINWKWNRC
jgi:predicted membrane protein